MHLHRLTFRGLGPFKDEQTIDFARLAAAPLFLIEGPTGSGKSTIIDAVVFALYGTVAGSAADDARLVSQYLEPGAAPFVDLVFETPAGIFRVRRTPKYERPVTRGSGTMQQNATAKLWRLNSVDAEAEGEPLATLPRDVNPEIERAVGLTRRQFVGTVVLPQGEFAAFLKADVADRQAILQRIFRTDLYERLQERLRAAKRDAEHALKQADQAVDVASGRFRQAAGLDDDWECPVAHDDLTRAVDAVLATLEKEVTDLQQARTAADAKLKAAQEHREALARRVALRDRKASALQRQRRLRDTAAEQTERVARTQADERAARVAGALEGARAAAERFGNAQSREQALRQDAPREAGSLDLAGLHEAVAKALGELASLEPLAALEAELPGRHRDLEAKRTRLAVLVEQIGVLEASLALIPEQVAELNEQRGAAERQAADQQVLAERVTVLADQAKAAADLARARADQQARADEAQAKLDAASAASSELDRMQRAHYAGMAAELAVDLAEGDACPVCGSTEHPTPAVPDVDHVSKTDVESADARHRALRSAAEAAARAKQEVDLTVAALAAKAGERGVAQIRADHEEATAALRAAEKAAAEAADLRRQLDEVDAQRRDHETTRLELTTAKAALGFEVEADHTMLEADRAAVVTTRGDYPSVAALRDVVGRERQALDALVAAVRESVEAAGDHERRQRELGIALAREGFADAAAASDALLDQHTREELESLVEEHRREDVAVQEILSDPALADVDPDEAIDETGAGEALSAASEAVRVAVERAVHAEKTLEQARLRASDVTAEAARRDTLAETSAPVILLGKVVMGEQSRLSMTLATYVLQQRFHAVVAAANDHLQRMSDGALLLQAHGEAADRRQRAGLGLHVIDLRTGDKPRGTGTLSGGETFYTALALALGLAGVVTGEAGGIRLGTLFVDEGFGSLDPGVLDDVLGVLTSLHDHGRVVGVVSHVEDLKGRIPDRIEVRRDGQTGPSTLMLTA